MRVVNEMLKELSALDKPTLLVFNKIDAIGDPQILAALKDEYPEAAFVSALRGIGLADLKTRVLDVMESDFAQYDVVMPVTDQKAIAYIRKVAEVVSEEYMYARVPYDDETHAVVRLQFRAAPKFTEDIEPLIARHRDLKVVEEV